MELLDILIIVTGFIFLLLAIDLYERRKFNFLHFLIFFGGTGAVVLFAVRSDLLDEFGNFFGVARGADLIVYVSIILLMYLYFELLHKITRYSIHMTTLTRYMALTKAIGNIDNTQIVFIIPCYGEDQTAIDTIHTVLEKGHAVIVIDDGNNKISFTQHLPQKNCVILTHPYNLGQGAALQTGAEYILQYIPQTRYVVHFDADGQHDLTDLPKYITAFEQNDELDIVLGSRFLGTTNMSKRRRLHKILQVWFMRLFVGLKLTDTNNGYRVIKGSSLHTICITLNGMAHASEIEKIIKDNALLYMEVPVTIRYTDYSLAKGQKLSNARNIVKKLLYKRFFYK